MTAAGDELRRAIVALRPELVRRARGWVSADAAEDLVHDTIVRALRFEAGYRAGTNARAWLHAILQNVFVKSTRRKKTERLCLDDLTGAGVRRWLELSGRELDVHKQDEPVKAFSWALPDPPSPPAPLSPCVARALDCLPEGFAVPLLMIHVAGFTQAEAAAELGIPQGTVASRAHRARRLLAARLGAAT